MENKYITTIIIGFIAVIIGLAFWGLLGNNIGTLAVIQTSANQTFTLPANNTITDLIPCGQQNTSNVVIYTPDGKLVFTHGALPSGNYTAIHQAGSDGYLSTRINVTNMNSTWASQAVNVSCSYEPRGYINEGGGRAVALIIPILFALAIAFAASPDMREWFKGLAGGK